MPKNQLKEAQQRLADIKREIKEDYADDEEIISWEMRSALQDAQRDVRYYKRDIKEAEQLLAEFDRPTSGK